MWKAGRSVVDPAEILAASIARAAFFARTDGGGIRATVWVEREQCVHGLGDDSSGARADLICNLLEWAQGIARHEGGLDA